MDQWFFMMLSSYGLLIQLYQLSCLENFGFTKLTKEEGAALRLLDFFQSNTTSTNSSDARNDINRTETPNRKATINIRLKLQQFSKKLCNTTISIKAGIMQYLYRGVLMKNKQFKACKWEKIESKFKSKVMSNDNSTRTFNISEVFQIHNLNLVNPNKEDKGHKITLKIVVKKPSKSMAEVPTTNVINHVEKEEKMQNISETKASFTEGNSSRYRENKTKRKTNCTVCKQKSKQPHPTIKAVNDTTYYSETEINENTEPTIQIVQNITYNNTLKNNATTGTYNTTDDNQATLILSNEYTSKTKLQSRNGCKAVIIGSSSTEFVYKGELIKNKQFRACRWRRVKLALNSKNAKNGYT